MCELLVRWIDKTNDDQTLDPLCSKAGDVIVIVDDGWLWSQEEMTAPFWRIIKAPGLAASTMATLTALEQNLAGKIIRYRGFALNVSDPRIVAALAGKNVVTLNPTQVAFLSSLKITKPPLTNTVVG